MQQEYDELELTEADYKQLVDPATCKMLAEAWVKRLDDDSTPDELLAIGGCERVNEAELTPQEREELIEESKNFDQEEIFAEAELRVRKFEEQQARKQAEQAHQ